MTTSASPAAPTTDPAATSRLPLILYIYCLMIHPAFLVIPFFAFNAAMPTRDGLSLVGFFRLDATDPLALTLYAAGLATATAAILLPRLLVARIRETPASTVATPRPTSTAATKLFVPYMARLLLFEIVTTFGLVMGILHASPLLGVPFFVVGFAGALASPPTAAFFERFGA
jgi:hypothetical protein